MNVAAESMLRSQVLGDPRQLLHRVIGVLNDTATEKQSLDVVSFVKLHRQIDDFVNRETGTRRVARHSIDAVLAIVDAVIGQQDF